MYYEKVQSYSVFFRTTPQVKTNFTLLYLYVVLLNSIYLNNVTCSGSKWPIGIYVCTFLVHQNADILYNIYKDFLRKKCIIPRPLHNSLFLTL